MKRCPYPVEALLPHAPPMILIDEVLGYGDGTVSATVAVRPGIPFFEAGRGVAAHAAIEWMAQTAGALAGIESREAGQKVSLGLLLGTRNFRASVPWFVEGERLIVTASLIYRDADMGVFDCAVKRAAGGEAIATAQLTTYKAGNVAALLASQMPRAAE